MIEKKKFFFILLPFLLNSSLNAFKESDFFSLEEMIDDNNESFFSYEAKNDNYTPERAIKALTRSCDIDEEGIVEIQRFLRLNFYKRTNPINQRSIQDLPQFYFFNCPPPQDCCKSWQLFVQPFLQRTGEANFTRDGVNIGSYLALQNANLIISDFEELIGVDIPEVISILERFRLETHRGGIMFGGLRKMNNWYMQVRTPLIYVERNYNLDEADQERLREVLGVVEEEVGEDENEFNRDHFIADRFGIGDTRLNIGYIFRDCPSLYLAFGLESTIPSAFAFKKGLYGNHFSKDQPDPELDICELLNLVTMGDFDEAIDKGTEFLIDVVDRLSRILLENSPGNNGHLGLGTFVYTDMYIMNNLRFKTRAALEYLLPAPERRYFIKKKNPADFDRLENPDPANAQQDIMLIQQEIINTFFPSGFDTVVYPGFLFKLTTALTQKFMKRYQLMLGYDLWWQQAEKLGRINALKEERRTLRKDIASKSAAIQNKFFASATMFNKGDCCDWSLSLFGDITFLRSGIGKDFNISLRFEWLL
jgi:hypothetical protein